MYSDWHYLDSSFQFSQVPTTKSVNKLFQLLFNLQGLNGLLQHNFEVISPFCKLLCGRRPSIPNAFSDLLSCFTARISLLSVVGNTVFRVSRSNYRTTQDGIHPIP